MVIAVRHASLASRNYRCAGYDHPQARVAGRGHRPRSPRRQAAVNPHVPELLLGRLEIPDRLPDSYALGSVEEAILYFLKAEEAWAETPGALDWLAGAIDSD